MFAAKIRAIIRNQSDKIGFDDDNYTVSPIIINAKRSHLDALPYILLNDSIQPSLYRLVLEHGDFGIHNMSMISGSTLCRSDSMQTVNLKLDDRKNPSC